MSVGFAIRAELGKQLFVARTAELDSIHPHPEIVFVAPIGNEDIAVVAEAHRLRVIETRAVRRGASDRVAPIVSASFDIGLQRHSILPSRRCRPLALPVKGEGEASGAMML